MREGGCFSRGLFLVSPYLSAYPLISYQTQRLFRYLNRSMRFRNVRRPGNISRVKYATQAV